MFTEFTRLRAQHRTWQLCAITCRGKTVISVFGIIDKYCRGLREINKYGSQTPSREINFQLRPCSRVYAFYIARPSRRFSIILRSLHGQYRFSTRYITSQTVTTLWFLFRRIKYFRFSDISDSRIFVLTTSSRYCESGRQKRLNRKKIRNVFISKFGFALPVNNFTSHLWKISKV